MDHNSQITALERELAFYEAQGKADRVRQVQASLAALRGEPETTAVEPAAETVVKPKPRSRKAAR